MGIAKLRWRTNKIQELFAFLLHHRNKWVPKDQILEELWGAYGQDRSITHLHTSVYQIRKLLKDEGIKAAVEYAQDSYRLISSELTTDVEAFEAACLVEGIASEQDRIRAVAASHSIKETTWRNMTMTGRSRIDGNCCTDILNARLRWSVMIWRQGVRSMR